MDTGQTVGSSITSWPKRLTGFISRKWKILRWVATGVAGLFIAGVGVPWITAWGAQNHWFDDPNAVVTTAMTWLNDLVAGDWFKWTGGISFGFAAGAWIDLAMRRIAAPKPLTPVPVTAAGPKSLSRDDAAIAMRSAFHAIHELQHEIKTTISWAERSLTSGEEGLTKKFAPLRPKMEALLATVSKAGIPVPDFSAFDWFEVQYLRGFLAEIEPFLANDHPELALPRALSVTDRINERFEERRKPKT